MFKPKNVSQLIRMYLIANDMTRSAFAKKIGLSHVTLCSVVNSKTHLSNYILKKLQPAFDRDQNELLKTFYIEARTKEFEDNLTRSEEK